MPASPPPINSETPATSFLVSERSCSGSVKSVGWRFLAKSSTLNVQRRETQAKQHRLQCFGMHRGGKNKDERVHRCQEDFWKNGGIR